MHQNNIGLGTRKTIFTFVTRSTHILRMKWSKNPVLNASCSIVVIGLSDSILRWQRYTELKTHKGVKHFILERSTLLDKGLQDIPTPTCQHGQSTIFAPQTFRSLRDSYLLLNYSLSYRTYIISAFIRL